MLKKIFPILIIVPFCILRSIAQDVHKPGDLLKIIQTSSLIYTPGELYIDIPDKDYSNLLTSTNIYAEDSGGKTVVKKLRLAKEADTEWNNAETAFIQDKNYKEARKHYKNVLDLQPDYYPAKIQIAKTFEKEGDYEKAESSYKQAI